MFAQPFSFKPQDEVRAIEPGTSYGSALLADPALDGGKQDLPPLGYPDLWPQTVFSDSGFFVISEVSGNCDAAFAIQYPGDISDLKNAKHEFSPSLEYNSYSNSINRVLH